MNTHILVIEDNLDMRENIAEILELSNYKVTTAENGQVGVEKAREILPDLILCDIMMPELNGYGVLFILSKNAETASIPFIFLTAKTERQDIRKGMNLGADDYITKPFEENDLMQAIESRIKRNEIIKQEFTDDERGLDSFFNEAKGAHALHELSENRTKKKVKKKSVIFLEGNSPRALYFVNRGKVKTFVSNEDGKELITGIFNQGDFIGYHPLFQECEYKDSAMALEETELSVISKEDFFHLINSNRDVSLKFIKMLAKDVIEHEEELINLAYNTVRRRVAEGLLKVSSKYGQMEFPIAREDLANIVGTAQESVIRVLSEFKEMKIITTSGRKVKILDKVGLENIRY